MGDSVSSARERLLALAQIKRDTVEIDGESFTIREVEAIPFGEYGAMVKEDKARATAFLIASCVVDENDQPVLSMEDALLLAKSARISMPIVSKVMELSGFGRDDEKKSDAG